MLAIRFGFKLGAICHVLDLQVYPRPASSMSGSIAFLANAVKFGLNLLAFGFPFFVIFVFHVGFKALAARAAVSCLRIPGAPGHRLRAERRCMAGLMGEREDFRGP